MTMNIGWIKEQLQAAKVRKPVGDATMKLIDLIETFELSDPDREKTIEMFTILVNGHAYIRENKKEVWLPARPGDIKVTDQVRVRADAFTGKSGQSHNGRRGVVVGVRYGDIIIKTNDGKEPTLDGSHYSPYHLEKLVQV
jgi:hypothetical protein